MAMLWAISNVRCILGKLGNNSTNAWKAGGSSFGSIAGANANAWRSRQRIHKPRLNNRKNKEKKGKMEKEIKQIRDIDQIPDIPAGNRFGEFLQRTRLSSTGTRVLLRIQDSSGGGQEAIGQNNASDDKPNMRWRSKTGSTYVRSDVNNASTDTNTTSAADNDHRVIHPKLPF